MLQPARDAVDQARPDVSSGGLFRLQLCGDREQKVLPLPKGNRRAQLAHQGHFFVVQGERRQCFVLRAREEGQAGDHKPNRRALKALENGFLGRGAPSKKTCP
jgi:hypothetical protein